MALALAAQEPVQPELLQRVESAAKAANKHKPAACLLQLVQTFIICVKRSPALDLQAAGPLRNSIWQRLQAVPWEQRVPTMRCLLHCVERRLPHSHVHRTVLTSATFLALCEHNLEDFVELALERLKGVRRFPDVWRGEVDPTCLLQMHAARAMGRLQQHESAIALAKRAARAAAQLQHGPGVPCLHEYSKARSILAELLCGVGRHPDAIAELQRALAQKEGPIACKPCLADLWQSLADTLRGAGQWAECSSALQQRCQVQTGRSDSIIEREQAKYHGEQAQCCVAMGQLDDALRHRQLEHEMRWHIHGRVESLEDSDDDDSYDAPQLGVAAVCVQYHIGVLHVMLGQHVDALQHLCSCETRLQTVLPCGSRFVARAQAWLAHAHLARGMPQPAVRNARMAVRAFEAPWACTAQEAATEEYDSRAPAVAHAVLGAVMQQLGCKALALKHAAAACAECAAALGSRAAHSQAAQQRFVTLLQDVCPRRCTALGPLAAALEGDSGQFRALPSTSGHKSRRVA